VAEGFIDFPVGGIGYGTIIRNFMSWYFSTDIRLIVKNRGVGLIGM